MKIIFFILLLLPFSLLKNSFVTSDEAVNLQMVKNIEDNISFAIKPSYDPGGHENWEKDSLSIIQMTPFFHWVHYVFKKITFLDYIKSATLLNTILFLLLLFIFLQQIENEKRKAFILIYSTALIPLHYLILIEHEVFLTVFGFSALHLSSLGLKKEKPIYFLGSGFSLGLSFLSKLWLSGTFGIGLLFILIFSVLKDKYGIKKYLKYTLCTLIAFILTSSFHLIIIAIFSKQDLGLWLDNVYFGVFGSGEDHRDKINTVTYFNQPFHYYFFVLIRDLFNFIPLIFAIIFFGKNILLKKINDYFSVGCIGVITCLFLLSKVNSKDALYILPIYFSLIFLITTIFIDIKLKKYKLVFFLSIISLTIWYLVGKFTTTNSLTNEYYLTITAGYLITSGAIFLIKNKVTHPYLLGVIIFPFLLNSNYEKDLYTDSIDFIKNKNFNNSPRDTYIIADDYSHIGYHVWNRVLKYDWALSESDLNQLMSNKEYKFYVLNKKTKNKKQIKNIAADLDLKIKKFKDHEIIYRD